MTWLLLIPLLALAGGAVGYALATRHERRVLREVEAERHAAEVREAEDELRYMRHTEERPRLH